MLIRIVKKVVGWYTFGLYNDFHLKTAWLENSQAQECAYHFISRQPGIKCQDSDLGILIQPHKRARALILRNCRDKHVGDFCMWTKRHVKVPLQAWVQSEGIYIDMVLKFWVLSTGNRIWIFPVSSSGIPSCHQLAFDDVRWSRSNSSTWTSKQVVLPYSFILYWD